jgi:DNA-binding transcriptional LysR family regulator
MHVNDRIGRRLKLHDLNVLLAVVEVGSMSKAAALLNTTQSAVSRSIAELEHAVGAQLLDRGPQGVEPTEYGRALLNRGVAAFGELQQGVRDIEHLSDPGAGELRIGTSTSMAEGIVLTIIERLSQEHPRAVFHVVAGVLPGLYDDLRARRIELGLFAQPNVDLEQDVNCDVLLQDGLVVVAGVDNPLARRRKIDLAELVNEPWTWPESGTGFDASVIQAFRASGLKPPRATVYAQAINMRTRLAANGRFLAVVPAHIMQFRSRHLPLKVLPVDLPGTQRQTGIVTLKNRTLSPLAQRFIAHAHEIAGELAVHGRGKVAKRKVSDPC